MPDEPERQAFPILLATLNWAYGEKREMLAGKAEADVRKELLKMRAKFLQDGGWTEVEFIAALDKHVLRSWIIGADEREEET